MIIGGRNQPFAAVIMNMQTVTMAVFILFFLLQLHKQIVQLELQSR